MSLKTWQSRSDADKGSQTNDMEIMALAHPVQALQQNRRFPRPHRMASSTLNASLFCSPLSFSRPRSWCMALRSCKRLLFSGLSLLDSSYSSAGAVACTAKMSADAQSKMAKSESLFNVHHIKRLRLFSKAANLPRD